MIKKILKRAISDAKFAALVQTAREYACIYLITKNRQKGCDGMGELAMVREELRDSAAQLIKYCMEMNYLSDEISFDIDLIAEELVGLAAGE